MNNIKKIAVAAAVLCASFAAQAQEVINPSWYIQPSINASKPDSDFSSDKTGYGAGLRFGKPVSPQWDVQFGTTYTRSKDNGNRYQQNTLGVDGLLFFNRNPSFAPFLVSTPAPRNRDMPCSRNIEAQAGRRAVGLAY